jgi:hypothetical protein
MKITLTTTEVKESSIEVSLPYFCKNNNTIYKVVDEQTVISAYSTTDGKYGYTSIVRSGYWVNKSDIANATVCSEDEFNAMYEKALSNLQMEVHEEAVS